MTFHHATGGLSVPALHDNLMQIFLRRFGAAIGIQVVLCLAMGLLAGIFSPRLEFFNIVLFYIYSPTVYLIWKFGRFKGESAMVYPMIIGVPSGIILYAFLFALAFGYFRRQDAK